MSLSERECPICHRTYRPYREYQKACSRNCREKLPEKREVSRAYHSRPETRERKNGARRVANNDRQRAINLRQNIARYGLAYSDYEAMLQAQGNRCSICGASPDPNGKRAASRLHVDHDHVTGKIRGLLCLSCNLGIGHFRDDIDRLHSAVAYIEKHRSVQ